MNWIFISIWGKQIKKQILTDMMPNMCDADISMWIRLDAMHSEMNKIFSERPWNLIKVLLIHEPVICCYVVIQKSVGNFFFKKS